MRNSRKIPTCLKNYIIFVKTRLAITFVTVANHKTVAKRIINRYKQRNG